MRAKRLKTKGIYFLYRTLQAFGFPLLLLYLLLRTWRNKTYFPTLFQRLGFLPRPFRQTTPGAIWLHAVSVGEVIAVVELVRRLRAELPKAPVFVSTSTLAGRAAADDKLRGLAAGIFYAPLDMVFSVRRVLRHLRPSVVVVAETEIWPNLFREVKRTGAGLLVVNGRVSDRAAPRYFRYRWFFSCVLRFPDLILAQTEALAARFVAMGAPAERTRVGGNLKYDFQPREAPADSPVRVFLDRARPAKVWVAASTMPPAAEGDPDEDDVVIAAYQQLRTRHPELILVLVPRRPERFETAAKKLGESGIPFVRRTQLGPDSAAPVLLLDTIGELSGLFSLADMVFMGGTLASRGGHNILEPAFFGRPIIIGPHMENFPAIAESFRASQACLEIRHGGELAQAVERLIEHPGAYGDRARSCAEHEGGAAKRAMEEIRGLHDRCLPCDRPPWFWMLWPLSRIWLLGSRLRRHRELARRRRLGVPVVSVGNLSMGGTGKTPIVLFLAERLRSAGRKPGILTRGYGRRSPAKQVILAPGSRVAVEHSGDEPQMFLAEGVAPVGIGADRYQTGRLLQQQFGADVLILDDGYQHLRLDRQVNICLVDALEPFRGCEVFPLGRLREPMCQLGRATAFIITRSNCGRINAAVEHHLRRHNPGAPVFHSRALPLDWVEFATGRRFAPGELPFHRVGAFCGLGNPRSFWSTLEDLGLDVVNCVEFEDHHSYVPQDLRFMAHQFSVAGAECAVTTEKDTFNLFEGCGELFGKLPLFWLRIRADIIEESALMKTVLERL